MTFFIFHCLNALSVFILKHGRHLAKEVTFDMIRQVHIQKQDSSGNWRTVHTMNDDNPQRIKIEFKNQRNSVFKGRARAIDAKTGHIIDME